MLVFEQILIICIIAAINIVILKLLADWIFKINKRTRLMEANYFLNAKIAEKLGVSAEDLDRAKYLHSGHMYLDANGKAQ